jgi:ribosomal-protein-alanine N-acetyltransferase
MTSIQDPFSALCTERLMMRRWQASDQGAAYAFWGDPEVMRYAGGPDANEQVSLDSLLAGDRAFEMHGVCLWPLIVRQSGELIGCCGFHMGEHEHELELAYHLHQAHWGKGYATEAAKSCLVYGFESWGATSIVASTYPENTSSMHVLDKLGFRFMGMEDGERLYCRDANSWFSSGKGEDTWQKSEEGVRKS